ncbi:MAG: MarR family winged helix-turn-helix transcriptional regulator [Anaerovoracaceae bacterium]
MHNVNSGRGERFFINFSIIHRSTVKFLISRLKEESIEDAIPPIIMLTYKNPGVTQDYIAKTLRIDKGAIAKGIQKQIKAGYIDRAPSQSDKRAYNLSLTSEGEAIIPKLQKIEKELKGIFTSALSPDEVLELDRLLKKISTNIDERGVNKK